MKNKLTKLNTLLRENKFLTGDKLTYVDLILVESIESINELTDHTFKKYPNIKRHFDLICELPNIKKYRVEKELLTYNNQMIKYDGSAEKK